MESSRRPLTDREIAGRFNRTLGREYRVRLIGGAEEPLYLPDAGGWSVIRYTRDYAASALHELAHWCIAGPQRRRRVDYGYWYQPPPRSAAERAAFAEVELPVQALESVLAAACGVEFRVSVDDPGATTAFADGFGRAVAARARCLALRTLPPRAARLVSLLAEAREAV